MKKWLLIAILLASALYFASSTKLLKGNVPFVILSGSENKALEPLLFEYAERRGIDLSIKYIGSVDMMLALQGGELAADAVWPASTIWLSLGDRLRRIKHQQSIMFSPVVFGIKQSKAAALGFVGRNVTVLDILKGVQQDQLTFAMTSATQSNSGASAYLGFLNAFAANAEALTSADLANKDLQTKVQNLLKGISRSAGSSGWLKDLVLAGDYDAMVNYESLLIEANQSLEASGKEPFYIIYPVDGIVLADSPLGFNGARDDEKESIFLELKSFLLSPEIQQKLLDLGRRVPFGGNYDKNVWRLGWGIDPVRILSSRPLPNASVISEALVLYQTLLRKPAFTVYALDFSGSMKGDGAAQLKQALEYVLDSRKSAPYLIQSSDADVALIYAFNDRLIQTWKVDFSDPSAALEVLEELRALQPTGGTDIFSPARTGLTALCKEEFKDFQRSVVLMTDGISNSGETMEALGLAYSTCGADIPIFGIMFGDASKAQLDEVTQVTRGKVFDGRKDLQYAFREVRGYSS